MKPLIAANWKMHGDMSWRDKPAEFDKIIPRANRQNIDVLICPPTPFIAPMVLPAKRTDIWLGAQNCHAEQSGAHTGEVSAGMLKSVGANFVIVGHSERRAGGETDAGIAAKAQAVLAEGLTPIICVGESLKQREAGQANDVVSAQLAASIPHNADMKAVIIAYEPIWAIGTGKTATPADIKTLHAHIRKIVGRATRILYGGSVKPANAHSILSTPNVNGALIGGASLDMQSLAEITQAVA